MGVQIYRYTIIIRKETQSENNFMQWNIFLLIIVFNDYSFYDLFVSQIPLDVYLAVSYIGWNNMRKGYKTLNNISITFLTISTCTIAQTLVHYAYVLTVPLYRSHSNLEMSFLHFFTSDKNIKICILILMYIVPKHTKHDLCKYIE